MFQDITERKRAEEALRESEEKYRSLVEYSADSVYMLDRELRYLFVNEELLRRLGLPREEVLGRKFEELHTAEETKEFAARAREVFETGRVVQQEHYHERLGRFFLRTISPVRDPKTGEVRAITVVGKDITEFKIAQEKLFLSEEKLRKIIDATPDIIAVVNTAGELIDGNQALLNRFGFSTVEEMVGRKFLDFVGPEDKRRMAENLKDAMKLGQLRNIEVTLSAKDGEFPAEISLSVIQGPSNRPESLVLLVRDITERKLAQKRSRELIYRIYNITPGDCYLIQSQELAYRLFAQLLLHEVPGLCLSRERPDKLLQYGIPKDKMVIISGVPVAGFESVDDLQKVSIRISEFIRENKESVVLLGGLEYLISRFGFESVYKFLQEKRFSFMEARANLLLPIDLATLSEKERALLVSELRQLGQ
jgi:PAS domain S-box-containing protein